MNLLTGGVRHFFSLSAYYYYKLKHESHVRIRPLQALKSESAAARCNIV